LDPNEKKKATRKERKGTNGGRGKKRMTGGKTQRT